MKEKVKDFSENQKSQIQLMTEHAIEHDDIDALIILSLKVSNKLNPDQYSVSYYSSANMEQAKEIFVGFLTTLMDKFDIENEEISRLVTLAMDDYNKQKGEEDTDE